MRHFGRLLAFGPDKFLSLRHRCVAPYALGLLFLNLPVSCASPIYLFTPPGSLEVPFKAQDKGATAESTLRVPVKDGYTFYLRLESAGKNPDDRHRVQAVSGVIQISPDGKVIHNPVLSIPVKLLIRKMGEPDGVTILDDTFYSEPVESWGAREFYNTITGIALERGEYNVRIESLRNNAVLNDINVELDVHVRSR